MNYNPNKNEIEFVNNSLEKFNNEHAGPDNHVLLNIVEYDENQNVIAGILGGTYWGWLHIRYYHILRYLMRPYAWHFLDAPLLGVCKDRIDIKICTWFYKGCFQL